MNQLMRLIYQNRFEKLEDLNPISREAEETFSREIRPMLEAKLSFEEMDFVDRGLAQLLTANTMGSYLSGMRDLFELLNFNGNLDELGMRGGATA